MKLPSGDICVAVKIMKPSIIEDAPVKFLQEAAIMGQFFHPNIIELFGIVSLNKPVSSLLITRCSVEHWTRALAALGKVN